ncbi:hypothetical protein RQP46_004500 [Phenoliferia psychrophenolica]
MRFSSLPLVGAFLALAAFPSFSLALPSPALTWRNPASLSRTLPSLSSVLFDSTPCARRDLAFPAGGLGGILVVSIPTLAADEVVSVEDMVGAEVLQAASQEDALVAALRDRIHCGVEVRVLAIENLEDVLDETSELNTVLAPSYTWTLLSTLSPSSLLLLASPQLLASPTSFSSRKARIGALLRGATTGASGITIGAIWIIGILFIVRRVWTNKKAAAKDRRDSLMEEEGDSSPLLYARESEMRMV